jgi:hypothetical protein
VETIEFALRFDPVALPLRALGIKPSSSFVRLHEGHMDARFGRWRVRTPYTNVKDVRITLDYRFYTAIGPRMSLSDGGVTFGSSTVGGVCVCFHEKVAALSSKKIHPGLTITVEDIEGFSTAIRERAGLA